MATREEDLAVVSQFAANLRVRGGLSATFGGAFRVNLNHHEAVQLASTLDSLVKLAVLESARADLAESRERIWAIVTIAIQTFGLWQIVRLWFRLRFQRRVGQSPRGSGDSGSGTGGQVSS